MQMCARHLYLSRACEQTRALAAARFLRGGPVFCRAPVCACNWHIFLHKTRRDNRKSICAGRRAQTRAQKASVAGDQSKWKHFDTSAAPVGTLLHNSCAHWAPPGALGRQRARFIGWRLVRARCAPGARLVRSLCKRRTLWLAAHIWGQFWLIARDLRAPTNLGRTIGAANARRRPANRWARTRTLSVRKVAQHAQSTCKRQSERSICISGVYLFPFACDRTPVALAPPLECQHP